jgi:hypothetical protein
VQAEAYKVCRLVPSAKRRLIMIGCPWFNIGSSLPMHPPLPFRKVSTETQALNQIRRSSTCFPNP